jgi:hypothetical protein
MITPPGDQSMLTISRRQLVMALGALGVSGPAYSTEMDPATYRGRFNSMMIWQFYDTLWRYKDGSHDQFEPALASSWQALDRSRRPGRRS